MDFIQVAKIINSHGIKGAVKIFLLTSNIDRFNNGCKFYIDKNLPVTVKSVRKVSDDIAILEFNEYSNINDILKFKNLGLYVEESDLDKLSEGEYYIYKLIGLDVFDQNLNKVGIIKNVLSTLANDVYEIEYKNKLIYVPVVSHFVKDIDIENNKVIINFLEGMLDD